MQFNMESQFRSLANLYNVSIKIVDNEVHVTLIEKQVDMTSGYNITYQALETPCPLEEVPMIHHLHYICGCAGNLCECENRFDFIKLPPIRMLEQDTILIRNNDGIEILLDKEAYSTYTNYSKFCLYKNRYVDSHGFVDQKQLFQDIENRSNACTNDSLEGVKYWVMFSGNDVEIWDFEQECSCPYTQKIVSALGLIGRVNNAYVHNQSQGALNINALLDEFNALGLRRGHVIVYLE